MSGITWVQLHAAVTHFPIALLMVAGACELAAYFCPQTGGRRLWLRQVSLLLLCLSVITALPALLTGYLHGRNLRFAPVQMELHWKTAVASTLLSALVLAMRAARRDVLSPLWRGWANFLLLLAILAVGITGHLGGEMVFGGRAGSQAAVRAVPVPAASPTPKATLTPAVALVARGEELVRSQEMECLSCHQLNGEGGRSAPELAGAGRRHPGMQWHLQHLKDPQSLQPNSTMPDYNWEKDPTLKEAEVRAMAAYLATLK